MAMKAVSEGAYNSINLKDMLRKKYLTGTMPGADSISQSLQNAIKPDLQDNEYGMNYLLNAQNIRLDEKRLKLMKKMFRRQAIGEYVGQAKQVAMMAAGNFAGNAEAPKPLVTKSAAGYQMGVGYDPLGGSNSWKQVYSAPPPGTGDKAKDWF